MKSLAYLLNLKIILHPFLFSIFPILSAINIAGREINKYSSVRSILFILGVVGVIFLLSYKLTNDWDISGIYCSFIVFLLFYYGIIFRILRGIFLIDSNITYHIVTILILIGSFFSLWYFQRRFNSRKSLWRVLSIYLNIVAIILLVQPTFNFLISVSGNINDPLFRWKSPSIEVIEKNTPNSEHLPDIYYIILDGYGRKDVLEKIYNYDNSKFLSNLSDRGFYIADNARSNYLQTTLSLASSLNMDYLQEFDLHNLPSSNREPLKQLIFSSKIRAILKENGYRFIAIDSGYPYTSILNADTYLSKFIKLNLFEEIFLTFFSPAIIMEEFQNSSIPLFNYQTHRSRIQFIFEQLTALPPIPGRKFVFAHIILPHPPFVYDMEGNPITPSWGYSLNDASHFLGNTNDYIVGYSNQLEFLNQKIIMIIDEIMKNSLIPPIIIIQGDHGPRMLTEWESIENSCTWEASSILYAVYSPNIENIGLYPSITPVNTFRIILNQLSLTELSILPDMGYFSNFNRPYQFIDITEDSSKVCLQN